jgi:hypothetical protein
MLSRPTAVLSTSPRSTRILVRNHDDDVLKATLFPPSPPPDPRALPMLFAGLALWHQVPVRVVLRASEGDAWCRLGLLDDLWCAADTIHYTVEVRGLWPARPQRIAGLGDFRDLRRLVPGDER